MDDLYAALQSRLLSDLADLSVPVDTNALALFINWTDARAAAAPKGPSLAT